MKHWNKIRNLILTLAVMMSSVFVLNAQTAEVQAEYTSYDELYPMSCDAFSVATLNSDGTFTEVSCTSDYNAAKQQMWALGDAGVIRHKASGSATKIIDMSAGVVYSYPQRNGSNTANIYQYMDGSGKSTYVTYHREMRFEGVYAWYGNGNGMVRVMLNGFDGYVNLSDVDLIPMAAVTNDIPLWLGGNDITPAEEYPFKTHVQQAYYRVEQNGNYRDLVYHCFNGWGGPTSWPSEWVFTIGPAADWMTTGSTYYSSDGTTFFNDRYFESQAGVYYPYYQFLPLRTKSNIPASVLDSFLAVKANGRTSAMTGKGQVFVDAGNEYGMNSLLVFAIGCLESGYGTSNFALNRNNLFGIAAYDSNPDMATYFSSVDQCIREEAGIFLRGYTDINDWRFFGPQLGNKGSGVNVKYAADSYWGMKMAAIAYEVDKYANGYNGNLTDYNTVSLGVVTNDANVNVLKSAGGSALYATTYGSSYQKNHMVSILAETGDYYKIQSTSYLNNGSVASVKGSGLMDYDWNNNAGYVPKSQITILNTAVIPNIGYQPTSDSPVNTVESAMFNDDGTLTLNGTAYRAGIYVTADNTVSQALSIQDTSYKEILNTALTSNVTDNDKVTYTGSIDLSKLANGTYLLSLTTAYSSLSQYSFTQYLPAASSMPEKKMYNGHVYSLSTTGGDAPVLELKVEDAECGNGAAYDASSNSCVCKPGYENYTEVTGCTVVSSGESGHILRRSIDSVAWADDTGPVVHMEGLAYFEGMDAKAGTDTALAIEAVNMNTGDIVSFDGEMNDLSTPINIYDGFDYTHVSWKADLDLTKLPAGDYYLKIRLTNGTETAEDLMITVDRNANLAERDVNSLKARFYASEESNFRLEVSLAACDIDRSVINKPTRRPTSYGENKLITLDNGVLSLDAYAFMLNTDVAEGNHPVYSLILMDGEGQTTTFSTENYSCSFNIAEMIGSSNNYDQACFTLSADLTSLEKGTYSIWLDTATDAARDVFSLYSYYALDVKPVTYNGRTYTITKSKVHNRYVLTIE